MADEIEDELLSLAKNIQASMARLQRRLAWLKKHEPKLYAKATTRMADEFRPAHKPKTKTKPVLNHVTRSKAGTLKSKGGANEAVKVYCDEFKARYGTYPAITGKTGNLIKGVVKSLGLERTCELLRTYVLMNKQWFTTKMHSVECFVSALNEIAVAHDTGAVVTRKQSQALESVDSTARAAEQYLNEEGAVGR